ncbi:PREDICTED: uncharacterized protein LOC109244931 [Nicotiana attenuata]|uniref:Myb-like domain-containing protein n=1 Tax=Nicotiana attenuata TaxID=49451 RepID=A0A314KYZ0_NICAT|nr:PREDICTED: uncharacterized protein LOC109244931 [Nicotiana attenuata]OIT34237.1 hypothetical protein A4A49_09714 [Nicotiana attenuata]
MQVNHQLTDHPNQGPVVLGQHAPEVMSFGVSNMEDIDQEMQLLDSIKFNSVEMPEAYHEGMNDVTEVSGHAEEKQPVYHRMKWTDEMVKLLITAVSYIGEDVLSNRLFIKKGKWRAISCVMAERGHHVSPQQCEDKFNDLNKKFKRLNDVLGRGTACHVVENSALLEMMDLSDDLKEEIKKLLGSKQLFYQELCSYNNQNRLFLPHDQEVQKSVLLAVKGKDKCETENVLQDFPLKRKTGGEERVSNMTCGSLNCTTTANPNLVHDMPAKRKVGGEERELNMAHSSLNGTTTLDPNVLHPYNNEIHASMNNEEREIQDEHVPPRLLQLEEQKLQIQAQILELEKKRFKHMRFCSKEDKELQKMMLDNEAIKLENQRLVLELKRSGMRPFD